MYHQSTPKKSSFRHGGSCGSASTTPSGGSPQQQRASSQHQAVNSPGHRSSSISSSSGRENRSDSCSSGGSIIIAIDASHQAELAFQCMYDRIRPLVHERIYLPPLQSDRYTLSYPKTAGLDGSLGPVVARNSGYWV